MSPGIFNLLKVSGALHWHLHETSCHRHTLQCTYTMRSLLAYRSCHILASSLLTLLFFVNSFDQTKSAPASGTNTGPHTKFETKLPIIDAENKDILSTAEIYNNDLVSATEGDLPTAAVQALLDSASQEAKVGRVCFCDTSDVSNYTSEADFFSFSEPQRSTKKDLSAEAGKAKNDETSKRAKRPAIARSPPNIANLFARPPVKQPVMNPSISGNALPFIVAGVQKKDASLYYQPAPKMSKMSIRQTEKERDIKYGRGVNETCVCLSKGAVYPSLPELVESLNVGSLWDDVPVWGEQTGTRTASSTNMTSKNNFNNLPYEISHENANYLFSYRFGKAIGYQFNLGLKNADMLHTLRIAWAEYYEPACERGGKRLDVTINDELLPELRNLDALAGAGGCGRALVVEVGFKPNKEGLLMLAISAADNTNSTTAYINLIQIFRHSTEHEDHDDVPRFRI